MKFHDLNNLNKSQMGVLNNFLNFKWFTLLTLTFKYQVEGNYSGKQETDDHIFKRFSWKRKLSHQKNRLTMTHAECFCYYTSN